jgi:hypothetical protein
MNINLFSSNTNTNPITRVSRHLQKGNGLQLVRSCWPAEPRVLADWIEIVLRSVSSGPHVAFPRLLISKNVKILLNKTGKLHIMRHEGAFL